MSKISGRPRSETPRAVFFDAGGTLLHVRPSVGHVYADTAARLGHPVDPASINTAFRAAWKRSLHRRREADYVATDGLLREEWRRIVADSFDGLLPCHLVGQAFEELYEHFAGPAPWSLAEGAGETVEALKRAGIQLGILSNWDSRLPAILEELGIGGWFDHLVVSHEVGVEKPHPRIFEEAARKAGASGGSLLVVGDSWEQDIEPALALGWQALWFVGGSAGASGGGGSPPLQPPARGQKIGSLRAVLAAFGQPE